MVNELVSRVIDILNIEIPDKNLGVIKTKIEIIMSEYDVVKKSTELMITGVLPESLKMFFITKKIEGMSENTLETYSYTLRDFFERTMLKVEDVTSLDIKKYLYMVQQEKNITNRTLESKRAMLSSFFGWCYQEGYSSIDPCKSIKPIKYSSKKEDTLSSVEMEKIRCACDNLRDRALIEFLYSTGCRVSEVANVKLEDIDFVKNEVQVLGKGNKYRTAYISSKAMYYINKYLESREEPSIYLFVSKRKPYRNLHKNGIEKIVRIIGENSGINRKLHPHLLRHTVATDCLKKGMAVNEIQKLLGHSNIATTMIYASTSDSLLKLNHERCLV